MSQYRYVILEVEVLVDDDGDFTAETDAALDGLEALRVVQIETNDQPMFKHHWFEFYPEHTRQRHKEGWT